MFCMYLPYVGIRCLRVFWIGPVLRLYWKVTRLSSPKNEDFVGKGYISDGLFVLNIISMNASVSSYAYIVESIDMWHGRLGDHVNFASIRKHKELRLINSSKSYETSKCLVCAESKYYFKKFFKYIMTWNTQLL